MINKPKLNNENVGYMETSSQQMDKFFSDSSEVRDLVEEQRVDFFVYSSLEAEISDSFKQVRDLIEKKNNPVVGTIGNVNG
ncbi:hypothetical protein [Bdellovibrio sp. HCB209]|uniref:hypothetical protein n=1 Tax=Bdellovibrio sp. HCB209 TaxID=3394354 RepID=UPI0039B428B2